MNASSETTDNNKSQKRAVLYLRRAVTRHGTALMEQAISHQRRTCGRKAKELGATVTEEYIDLGSTGSERRAGLRMMRSRITKGGIDYLLVERIDRLTRNMVDHAELELLAQKHGTKIVSCADCENERLRFDEIAQAMQKLVRPCSERRKPHVRR